MLFGSVLAWKRLAALGLSPAVTKQMRYQQGQIAKIILPLQLREAILLHCQRKLQGTAGEDKQKAAKAFGLMGGRMLGQELAIECAIPLFHNARDSEAQRLFMDAAMSHHATPSTTPFSHRGWVAEPSELDSALDTFRQQGVRLVGNYHMHRVAWEHDPLRDGPTELDMVLGRASRMFMFIISMVRPDRPIIRAFFEGIKELEVPVLII